MAEELSEADKLAELTGTEKSAILMMLLGEEEAGKARSHPQDPGHLCSG